MVFCLFRVITVINFIISGAFIPQSAGFCSRRTSSCGLNPINFPFWTQNYGDPRCNGYSGFLINCTEDKKAVINISNHPYIVKNVDSERIYVLDMNIEGQQCPRPRQNSTVGTTPFLQTTYDDHKMTFFYNCTDPPTNATQHLPCLDNRQSFAFLEGEIPQDFNWYANCEESVVAWVFLSGSTGETVPIDVNYTDALKYGLPLKYSTPTLCVDCQESGGQCVTNDDATSDFSCLCADNPPVKNGRCINDGNLSGDAVGKKTSSSTQLKVIIGVFTGVGILLLILLVIYRRILSNVFISVWNDKARSPTSVELFLESHHNRVAQRFRYSDIKKMTNSFKDKLGQGGYGSVFKGKLFDGRLVAVKVLSESKGDGEDFINEVSTIGTTNHVNVVSLLGFCTEGNKRALIYEFMPNGSLEKFIYHKKEANARKPLGQEKLYNIALGIGRGLDYLHRGCNTRILHLDIKPHNILLDQDFVPKISDFGLAKLCPPKESVISIHGPRGTLGYIAPEVYGIRYGGASHKSDVYSYGIMVLEMIGGRKNIDKTVKNSSEVYLPQLIFNRLERDIAVDDVCQEFLKDEMTRKMIVVALWCIQTLPADRPSISKVVEMFEGNAEELQFPPNPFSDHPVGSPGSTVSTIESRNYLSESSLGGR